VALGYDSSLFVLAFDHRGVQHLRTVFGVDGDPTAEQAAMIADAKSVVFDGFVTALAEGAPAEAAGILVDEEFGADLARKATANSWICAVAVERSGLPAFELEYGDDFAAHIEHLDPTFAKCLVRYNPDGDPAGHERSIAGLRRLSDWLAGTDRKFLCELIVPAEPAQLAAVGGREDRYIAELRPELMRRGIATFQAAGIEPDVWKLEGIDERADAEMVVRQVRAGGRDDVGCVVLGAGADAGRVEHWLRTAAGVDGYLGFAVGRSIWRDAVAGYLDRTLGRADATAQVAARYRRAIAVYDGAA
jgi:myo-inositol catabolism protein IolC